MKQNTRSGMWFAATCLTALLATAPAMAQTVVDLELSLVIDVSGSISATEYNQQRLGYADAFRLPTVQRAITSTTDGIAVNAVMFGTNSTEVIPWTHLRTTADINTFANTIQNTVRPFSGNTNVASGMQRGIDGLLNNSFDGVFRTMDVSGDGEANEPSTNTGRLNTEAQRNRAEGELITVNGIALAPDNSAISNFYTNSVVTSTGYAYNATTFDSFVLAIQDKILYEIGAVAGDDSGIYSGDTTFEPTWQRPNTNLSSLSATANNVEFDARPFHVGTSGNYDILSIALGWNNFAAVYAGVFDPSNPLNGLIAANDDLGSTTRAGFNNLNLLSDRQYYLVTTGSGNTQEGAFTNNITGAGRVTLGLLPTVVPESGTVALLAVGGLLGMCSRLASRRKKP